MLFHPVLGLSMPELGWVPAPRYLLRRDRILNGLAGVPAGTALEIGCGAGALLRDLRICGYDCVATETSAAAAAIARTVHQEDSGVRILDQPEADWEACFDLLLACEVLEHIEDDRGALAQWVDWLKPGGRFLISVPGRPEKWDASDEWAGHYRRYTRQSLHDLCASAGLNVDTIESYGYPMINLIAPIRARSKKAAMKRGNQDMEMAEATAASGVDRGLESKLFPLLNNPIGRTLVKVGCRWQERHLHREKGLALLAWATRS